MVNANTYLPVKVSETNKDDDNMNISMELEQYTVEYQETLKVVVKIITKNNMGTNI